jgi:hypothetical protein
MGEEGRATFNNNKIIMVFYPCSMGVAFLEFKSKLKPKWTYSSIEIQPFIFPHSQGINFTEAQGGSFQNQNVEALYNASRLLSLDSLIKRP